MQKGFFWFDKVFVLKNRSCGMSFKVFLVLTKGLRFQDVAIRSVQDVMQRVFGFHKRFSF